METWAPITTPLYGTAGNKASLNLYQVLGFGTASGTPYLVPIAPGATWAAPGKALCMARYWSEGAIEQVGHLTLHATLAQATKVIQRRFEAMKAADSKMLAEAERLISPLNDPWAGTGSSGTQRKDPS